MKVVASLRNQFGGHAILPETAAGSQTGEGTGASAGATEHSG